MEVESNRCFARQKARELTSDEVALVGGGESDVFHSEICLPTFDPEHGGGGGGENHVGCTYT